MTIFVMTSEKDRNKLDAIGHARNAAKKPEWTRRKTDIFSDTEVDCLGMYGEHTVATYLGVPIDDTISVTGDDGHDLHYEDINIAVKYNHRWKGYLMVEERKNDDVRGGFISDFTSDIIILTHGNCKPPTSCDCRNKGGLLIAVAGWLTHAEFMDKMIHRDLGIGGRYICHMGQLNPMHELWEFMLN